MRSKDDELLRLGKELFGMISAVHATPPEDVAFSRRRFTFPGGAVHVFVVRGHELAEAFETAAAAQYSVETRTPPSARS